MESSRQTAGTAIGLRGEVMRSSRIAAPEMAIHARARAGHVVPIQQASGRAIQMLRQLKQSRMWPAKELPASFRSHTKQFQGPSSPHNIWVNRQAASEAIETSVSDNFNSHELCMVEPC